MPYTRDLTVFILGSGVVDGYWREICENEIGSPGATLSCPVGRINITFANYGRTRPYSEVCHSDAWSEDVNCYTDPRKMTAMYGACQGEQTCQVTKAILPGGDPCSGTYKYVKVKYECVAQGTWHWRVMVKSWNLRWLKLIKTHAWISAFTVI